MDSNHRFLLLEAIILPAKSQQLLKVKSLVQEVMSLNLYIGWNVFSQMVAVNLNLCFKRLKIREKRPGKAHFKIGSFFK